MSESIDYKDAYFRFHRGSLDDSIQTRKKVESYDQLYNRIVDSWGLNKDDTSIKVEPYCYDQRIQRYTYMVFLTTTLNEGKEVVNGYPVGFIDIKWR